MTYYQRMGEVSTKRHVALRDGVGGPLRYEEAVTTDGFFGPWSLLYHIHPPTQSIAHTTVALEPVEYLAGIDMKPNAWSLSDQPLGGDAVTGRTVIFGNEDVTISAARPNEDMTYFYRSGYADELLFIHEGTGRILTPYGILEFGPLDQVVVPRGTTYQVSLDGGTDQRWIVIEARGAIEPPERYFSSHQLSSVAAYTERDLTVPTFDGPVLTPGTYEVRTKVDDTLHCVTYDHHPCDVVGWDGCLYPWSINMERMEISARSVHAMPPTFQSLQGPNLAIFNAMPRPAEFYPDALTLQPYHTSMDCDELSYAIRSARGANSIAYNPGLLPHGLPPQVYEASIGQKSVDVCVFLIDTFRPLRIAKNIRQFAA